ncbi:4-hydroxy-tetrahydrodipicolinate reductase [bioreactor metagenome]|uniref:4-hydroxy-tetrahydrodipicolinate reductase n=1 Tax=bioreactor metagenome TaxID=1076179 RepID=A0A645FRI9_9ZZZZ
MIKVILSGCNGRMGRVINGLISAQEDMMVVAGIDINTSVQNPYPVFSTADTFEGDGDVVVDFSHPSSLESVLNFANRKHIPIVIATTGLSPDQVGKIREVSKNLPVFYTANMSLGVNLIIDLVKRAAKVLQRDFDIEIIEKHHNQKVDAPSGTALYIADEISSVLNYEADYTYDRHSQRKKRGKTEIGIHAIRGGTIVGDHEVIFAGNNETIEIKHSASSREVFGYGAVAAIRFIVKQGNGLYNMSDYVNSF